MMQNGSHVYWPLIIFLNPRWRTTNGLDTCDIAIFQFVNMTVVRHIGFLKLQFYRLRTSETFCINVPHFVEIGHTVAESALGGLQVKEKKHWMIALNMP